MVFKLGLEAQKHWRRLQGLELIPKVISGVRFVDGEELPNKPLNQSFQQGCACPRYTTFDNISEALAVGLGLNASHMRRKEKALLMVEQDAPTKIRETRNQTFFQILTAG
jgi:hypothetical protein